MTPEEIAKAERQTASKLEDIRRDHVARYEWANSQIKGKSLVIDAACGVGYGSNILAKGGNVVTGIDISDEAIEYARKHWKHPRATFVKGDLNKPGNLKKADVAIAFECIEHIEDPRPMLKALRKSAKVLFASVPNEDVFPHNVGNVVIAHHFRHYTKGQFGSLLNECGWEVKDWFGQEGPESEVAPDVNGRTLVARCERCEIGTGRIRLTPSPKPEQAPRHVAIVALGPSMSEYTSVTRRLGDRFSYCDETWAVNAMGGVIQCDRIFHMDDVRIQEIRAEAQPESNIANMLNWMRKTPIPIITSRPHPDYPTTEAFPLSEVLTEFNNGYFNSTAAYAVAYAIYIGVETLSLFGMDFTYPNAHDAEKGRACVEYWLGMASERGIRIMVPKYSTLLDACHTQRERFYGYDTLDLSISQDEKGIHVDFTERLDLPSADEIEHAYDHSKHPNPLTEVQDAV